MKSNNFRKKGILYAVLALLCFINITKLWIFLIIFVAISVLYFWLANKHKKDKNNAIEQMLQDSKEKKKNKKKKLDIFEFEEKRKRKAAYKEYIASVKADFSNDIFKEELGEDYEDDDEDEDEDDDF